MDTYLPTGCDMITEAITTNYKYHIYELVEKKWEVHTTWDIVDGSWKSNNTGKRTLEAAAGHLRSLQNQYPFRTFKLVTEKITTVHEFIEE